MKRIPRAKHITSLAINYQQTNNQNLKQQLIQTLLSQYTTNGFQLNGVPLSLQDISHQYNLDINTIYKELGNISKSVTGFISSADLLDAHSGLLAMCLESSIRDKGHSSAQLSLMLASQGDTYRPYISGAVHDSLRISLQATKNLIDLASNFIPKSSEVIQLISDKSKTQGLSIQEAISHIHEASGKGEIKALQAEDTKALNPMEDIYITHNLSEMPEVRANRESEQHNMINVKAKQLIEGGDKRVIQDERIIEDVESEWEDL